MLTLRSATLNFSKNSKALMIQSSPSNTKVSFLLFSTLYGLNQDYIQLPNYLVDKMI